MSRTICIHIISVSESDTAGFPAYIKLTIELTGGNTFCRPIIHVP